MLFLFIYEHIFSWQPRKKAWQHSSVKNRKKSEGKTRRRQKAEVSVKTSNVAFANATLHAVFKHAFMFPYVYTRF